MDGWKQSLKLNEVIFRRRKIICKQEILYLIGYIFCEMVLKRAGTDSHPYH